jgi:hypothetical protein
LELIVAFAIRHPCASPVSITWMLSGFEDPPHAARTITPVISGDSGQVNLTT